MTTPTPAPLDTAWAFPLLGLDVSEKRIGLAIVDSPGAPPQPLFTYARVTRERDLAQCVEWVRRYHIGTVVLGFPLNMDGTLGTHAQWMQRFARKLRERLTIPVALQDERLTTVEADELLRNSGTGREARDERIDAVAAALILQRFCAEGPTQQVMSGDAAGVNMMA